MRVDSGGPHDRQPALLGEVEEALAVLGGQRRADRLQVIARIESVRDGADVLAERLAVAEIGRAGEHVDLRAGVVDVVFAGDLVAGEGEEVGERIAEHGATAMADMHRPGRIGRDILHVDGRAGALSRSAEAVPVGEDGAQNLVEDAFLQGQVDEARTGDLDLVHPRIAAQVAGDQLGEGARIGAGLLGEDHRRVGGEVAMRRVARRLDDDAPDVEALREAAGFHEPRERVGDAPLEKREDVHETLAAEPPCATRSDADCGLMSCRREIIKRDRNSIPP